MRRYAYPILRVADSRSESEGIRGTSTSASVCR